MANLWRIVSNYKNQLQEENKYVVFWKENREWQGCDFCIENDTMLSLEDKQFLEKIKEEDPRAVVLRGKEWECLSEDEDISIITSIIEFYYQHSFSAIVPSFLEENFYERTSNIGSFIKNCKQELKNKQEVSNIGFCIIPSNDRNCITIEKDGTAIKFNEYEASMLAEALPKNKDYYENLNFVNAEQEKEGMTKYEIMKMMENKLKNLSEVGSDEIEECCILTNTMLNIAEFLIKMKEEQ